MFSVAVTRPDKYDELLPICTKCIHVNTHTLYVIRCRIGSQCRSGSVDVNVSVVYSLKQKFSEEGVGLCEEMRLQPISELFTTDAG